MRPGIREGLEAALDAFDAGELSHQGVLSWANVAQAYGYRALADALDALAVGPASSTIGARRELARLDRAERAQREAAALLDVETEIGMFCDTPDTAAEWLAEISGVAS